MQRSYTSKDEASSPADSTEFMLLTVAIEKRKSMMTCR